VERKTSVWPGLPWVLDRRRSREGSREHDQRRGAGRVVDRSGPDPEVVAVSHHDDPAVRPAGHRRHEVRHLEVSVAGHVAANGCVRTVRLYGSSWLRNQSAARAAPSLPDSRIG
jgi:hypothetical protein